MNQSGKVTAKSGEGFQILSDVPVCILLLLLLLVLAGSRSQWAVPDFDCQLQIAMGTAGLHLPAPDRIGHCRTSSASSRSHWALPDFVYDFQIALGTADFFRDCPIAVGTAGLQPRLPDRSGHCRTSAATARLQWALPDFSRDRHIAVGIAGLQHVYMPERVPEGRLAKAAGKEPEPSGQMMNPKSHALAARNTFGS
eukprot:s334_g7.t1